MQCKAKRCYESQSRQLKNEGEKIFPRFARTDRQYAPLCKALHRATAHKWIHTALHTKLCAPSLQYSWIRPWHQCILCENEYLPPVSYFPKLTCMHIISKNFINVCILFDLKFYMLLSSETFNLIIIDL